MGRTSKFVLNSASTALLQVVTMVAGFITPRFLLMAYGSDVNGLISSINQFITYFNLVEAGSRVRLYIRFISQSLKMIMAR